MLVRFAVSLLLLTLRIVVNLMRLLLVVLVLLLIVKVLQLICAVILILSVWIWLKTCFAPVFVVLVLVRPLFMLILILINLIVFGFMIKRNLKDNTLSLFRAYAPGVVRSVARTPRNKGVKTLYRFYVWWAFDSRYHPLSGLYELSKAKELDSLGEIYYKIRFEY